ncbi:MAG: BA14K family protein [Pseudomonadota bacterium]
MSIRNIRRAAAIAGALALTGASTTAMAASVNKLPPMGAAISAPLTTPAGPALPVGTPTSDGRVQLAQRRLRRGRRGRAFRRGYRRGLRRGRRNRGRRIGRGAAIGLGALITGAIIANSARGTRGRAYRGDWERCDDRFRSFRRSDGTYQPYGGGPRRLCPYLR